MKTTLMDADERDFLGVYTGLNRCVVRILQSVILIIIITNINFHFYKPGVL